MGVYVVKFSVDDGPFANHIRSRSVEASTEIEAKRNLYELLHERAKKQGRILHYIDCDFWKVDKVI